MSSLALRVSKPARPYKIRLKKGDTVVVLSGKYKSQTGKVLAVHPRDNKVTVEGINVVKRHQKAGQGRAGGIVEITKPMWVSKVALQEPGSKRPSRIGYRLDSNGVKQRLYKLTGKEVSA